MQFSVRRVAIGRAHDKRQERPHNPQVRFGVGHRSPSQDVIPALRDGGRKSRQPRGATLGPPEDSTGLEQSPHWPQPATPTGHEQHTVRLLPLVANATPQGARKRQVDAGKTVPAIHCLCHASVPCEDFTRQTLMLLWALLKLVTSFPDGGADQMTRLQLTGATRHGGGYSSFWHRATQGERWGYTVTNRINTST